MTGANRERATANQPPGTRTGPAYVAAGSLERLQRCPHRLAAQLNGDGPGRRGKDPAMRLWAEVTTALRAAHDAALDARSSVADAIDRTVPAVLGVEEGHAFVRALDHYVEAFGDDDPLPFHPAAGVSSSRAVAGPARFELGTRVELLFDAAGAPLLRRVHLRGSGHGLSDEPSIGDLAAAVALRLSIGPALGDVALVVEHLWTSGAAHVRRTVVERRHLDAFRATLHADVHDAIGEPTTRAGWWCNDCALLTSCHAVPSAPATALQQRLTTRAAADGVRTVPLLRSQPTAGLRTATSADHDATLGHAQQPAPGVLVLTATRIRDFDECPRRFYLAHVLRVPAPPDHGQTPSDGAEAALVGSAVHRELHARHASPLRHDDPGLVADDVPNDPWILGRATAHASLCPSHDGATYLGGELDLRWLHRRKAVLLTGRVDALWRHRDGVVEIRDYKTGRGATGVATLEADVAAHVYLLLGAAHPSAPRAVRVGFELLGAEPARLVTLDADPARLAAATDLIETVADRIRKERTFPPTTAAHVCARCPYRDDCPKRVHGDDDTSAWRPDPDERWRDDPDHDVGV